MDRPFEKKAVLLGVTGSIAAYKACDVLREMKRNGADVRVILTEAAQRFIAPLTFETLSGNEVIRTLFPPHRFIKTRHISIAEWADCMLVCPATANIIGKVAGGIADDFLSTVIMASRVPVVFAPAMDYQMVQSNAYVANCQKLTSWGYGFVETEEGELASGAVGQGRLAKTESIIHALRTALFRSEKWKDIPVLVTAGPTRESVDPVRFLTNRSSGKMGYALAEEAAGRGAAVTLISGPSQCSISGSVRLINVITAAEMADAVLAEWRNHRILFMAAAVADYRPSEVATQKLKKGNGVLTLDLEPTRDILASLVKDKGDRLTIGFALETEKGDAHARAKLSQKHLDLICMNNPLEEGAGFEGDTNKVTIIDRQGRAESLPLMPKWAVARRILDLVEILL